MKQKIAITACASISSLGTQSKTIWDAYLQESKSHISPQKIGNQLLPVASITAEDAKKIESLRQSDPKYKALDNSVLYAIFAARQAIQKAGWQQEGDFGINIGSSRGATALFEKHHKDYLQKGKTEVLTSPTTTLGNISSWVAHDLKSSGPEISHSITCSTALHALLNGVAWLQAGMASKFLVGGSEAPLTPFTLAQMQALKIYATEGECRALDLEKAKNTMILGEGAAMITLEQGNPKNAMAYIEGIGYATDILEHSLSLSAEADCFQKSMRMALQKTDLREVDAIVMHAPGTILGDKSEYNAILKVFGKELPMLTSNKWKIGHTFGASGMLSVELALLMLQHNHFIPSPFASIQNTQRDLKKVLVNAVGFGGNAVSILVSI